jgi:hypothetical protein
MSVAVVRTRRLVLIVFSFLGVGMAPQLASARACPAQTHRAPVLVSPAR